MSDKYKILGISGSLREDSYNTSLLRAAKEMAPDDMSIEVYVPSELTLFSQDNEDDPPEQVTNFKKLIERSDGLIFSSPEHNFTISAAMKNAIEWGNRPYGDNSFFNKPAAIMSASPSHFGTVRAQNHMRQIFQDLSVVTFHWPTVLISNAHEKFKNGELVDTKSKEKVKAALTQLKELIDLLPEKELVFTTM